MCSSDLDTTQVSSFLSLLNVSEKSRDFAGWGWEGLPKIPFTTISILSSSFSHEDQDKIIQSALQGEKKSSILKSDAIKLRKWKNANPNLVIEEGIEKVLQLKPVTEFRHTIICYLEEKIKNYIKTNPDYSQKILNALKNKIPGKFFQMETTDQLLIIVTDEEAFKIFNEDRKSTRLNSSH